MTHWIVKVKEQIAMISGVLIVLAFAARFLFGNIMFFNWFMMIAGIIGILPIAIQAYEAIKVKVVSIDLLVTIAVIGAFIIQSFEEAAIVTFLFLFGAYLEQKTIKKTRNAIQELTKLAPEVALKEIDGDFVEVDVFDIDVDDILLVRTGDRIPVDGMIIKGDSLINESSVTGESVPVAKKRNSEVYAGTIIENGTLTIRADKVQEDTTFGKIIELVEDAQDSQSEVEQFIDKFAKYYTPAVLLLGVVVYLLTKNFELSITVLVLGCPGALVIGVPVSNVAGIGNGAKHGVLLKGSEVIRDFSGVDTIIFDKTGTLTIGKPKVSYQYLYGKNSQQALRYLKSIEYESDHPLAHSIVNYLEDFTITPVTKTDVIQGKGIKAIVNNETVLVGNQLLLEKYNVKMPIEAIKQIEQLESSGYSIVLTAVQGELNVVIGIRDQIRQDIKTELERMKSFGVKNLVVLSGDNQGSVDVIAKELQLTQAYGNMFPEDKAQYVEQLQSKGEIVAFVGDGINDSPSLALANVGIAVGSGTDVAIETSDIVLVNSDFKHLNHAFGLSRSTFNNTIQNIIIAVGTVAFLLFVLFFGEWLTMSIGMFVHEGSILLVILNGMRLLNYRLE